MGKPVIVKTYDPCWPQAFRRISQELMNGLQDSIISIEHVGSTSVPGLAAKPIIDLDVVISDSSPLETVIEKLYKLGYIHEGNLGIIGREAFRYEDKPHLYKHHLYVCRESSMELHRHLTFRDYLRSHPEDAAEYGAVKLEAASLYPNSIDDYMNHKAGVIYKIYVRCGLEKEE